MDGSLACDAVKIERDGAVFLSAPTRHLARCREQVRSTTVHVKLDRSDIAFLAALIVAAALGTWTSCLLVNDGAVFLSALWLGNTWDLYFSQDADRTVSMLFTYGPAWAARWAFGLSPIAYIALAHVLYFTVPLALWLTLRA